MQRRDVIYQVLLVGLVVVLGASHANVVSAGVNVWTSDGPEGGVVHALVIDSLVPSTLYAGAWGGGVFRSINGGASWSAVNTGPTDTNVKALAIDPATPTTLYAGTQGPGLFKSTDGGVNWSIFNSGLTSTYVLALAVDPATPTTVYAATYGGGVCKSTNRAGNWSQLNTGLTNRIVWDLAVDPVNPNILHAGTETGVFDLQQVQPHTIYLPLVLRRHSLTIAYWEQEDENVDSGILDPLVAEFMAANPGIIVVRKHYENEELREQFISTVQRG